MPLELTTVHEYKKVKTEGGGHAMRLVKIRPYVRLVSSGEPPIFCQEGRFFWEGGGEAENPLPGWVHLEAVKVKGKAREECGIDSALKRYDDAPIPDAERIGISVPIRDEPVERKGRR